MENKTMKAQQIAEAFLNKIPIEAVESGEGMHKVKLQKLFFLHKRSFYTDITNPYLMIK